MKLSMPEMPPATLLTALLTVFTAVFTEFMALLTEFIALLTALAAALLAFAAALFAPASPQAIPKALKAKSDESAITFFILKVILLSSSKINLVYFNRGLRLKRSLVPTSYFWNIAQYK